MAYQKENTKYAFLSKDFCARGRLFKPIIVYSGTKIYQEKRTRVGCKAEQTFLAGYHTLFRKYLESFQWYLRPAQNSFLKN